MPHPTSLLKYPREFEHLLDRASREFVALSFPVRGQAMQFRHRFYAYMKLIRDTDQRPDLKAPASGVMITVRPDRLGLSIGPGCDSWEGELLRSALQIDHNTPTDAQRTHAATVATNVSTLQAKLQKIRSTNGEK